MFYLVHFNDNINASIYRQKLIPYTAEEKKIIIMKRLKMLFKFKQTKI